MSALPVSVVTISLLTVAAQVDAGLGARIVSDLQLLPVSHSEL